MARLLRTDLKSRYESYEIALEHGSSPSTKSASSKTASRCQPARAASTGGGRVTVLNRAHLSDLHVRDDGRTLEGTALPYGQEADIREYGRRYIEIFAPRRLRRRRPGAAAHRHPSTRRRAALPIGVTRRAGRRADRLHGAWHVSDTELGNEVLDPRPRPGTARTLRRVRRGGRGSRWNHDRTRVERTRADLDHVAVVRRGAYPGARTAVRGAQGFRCHAYGSPDSGAGDTDHAASVLPRMRDQDPQR